MLYADRAAYGDWAKGGPTRWLQVLDPPRSARTRGGEGESGRFAASWGSPVTLDVAMGDGGRVERRETTQGRLFACLWHDDPGALDADEAPPTPTLQAELQRQLESTLPYMRQVLREGASGDAVLFVSSIDLSSDASLEKAESVWSALAAAGQGVRAHDAPPADCGVPDGGAVHPALVVRGIAIEGATETAATDALKAVLYNPGARAAAPEGDADAPAKADRFSVSRHGWLGPLVPADEDAAEQTGEPGQAD